MAQDPVPCATAEADWATATWSLGPRSQPDGISFAVHAPAATRVMIEFYAEPWGADAVASFDLAHADDGVWRGLFAGVEHGTLYGFRCWGENWPVDPAWSRGNSAAGFLADLDAHGNRFNPNKVLFDPYAREVTHNIYSDILTVHGQSDGIFGTGHGDYLGEVRRNVDTGHWAPKGIVILDDTELGPKPKLPPEQSIIYEAHVHNLTQHPAASQLTTLLAGEPGFDDVVNIPPPLRGTYRAAGLMAPYLKGLGVNTIEFLPIHQTNNSESGRPGKSNHWGYQTLGFFAPNRQYASDQSPGGPTREFKEMVNAFHDAGLEVYLDVVYNHTAEGGVWNGDVCTTGFVSLGGFATAEYYSMTNEFSLIDGATGTANQLNQSSPATRRLVMDSLRYWTEEMGVDGFRFDLATVLGRLPDAADREDWEAQKRFHPDHPLLKEISAYAHAKNLEVIAEAWDLWGYEVGNFPFGWGEWNGRFRDALRRFLKGDGNTNAFMAQFNADYEAFNDQGGPHRSVNFVTAHDGFTLTDLVSYTTKLNDQPWPWGPTDGGTDENLSWDSGGDHRLRRQRIRNFLTLLLLARGVPMLLSGDEYGRSQNGNNNVWSLNTIGMWNNYRQAVSNAPSREVLSPDDPELRYHNNLGVAETDPDVNPNFRLAVFLMHLRTRHPELQSVSWGDLAPGNQDTSYLYSTVTQDGAPSEGDRALEVHIDFPGGGFLVLVNMWDRPLDFTVPDASDGTVWRTLVDTSHGHEWNSNFWDEGTGAEVVGTYLAAEWSVVVLQSQPAPARPAREA
ncbi:alpha-amylase family glycosyl hydrolase [Propionicicella superfundia]|uniref:alpha-amylase family glycosyl hydrolase n=1 Tax=Propionicicella superfundia TaxID=348582 RepID=UPI0004221959|nr:alpha-amylase family glycosyl hydrolase [Propionicicella superfundia]